MPNCRRIGNMIGPSKITAALTSIKHPVMSKIMFKIRSITAVESVSPVIKVVIFTGICWVVMIQLMDAAQPMIIITIAAGTAASPKLLKASFHVSSL